MEQPEGQLVLEADEIKSEDDTRTEDWQSQVNDTNNEEDDTPDVIQADFRDWIEVTEQHDTPELMEVTIPDDVRALIQVFEHQDVPDVRQTRRDVSCDQCILGYDDIEDLYSHLVIFHYAETWATEILSDLRKEVLRVKTRKFSRYISRKRLSLQQKTIRQRKRELASFKKSPKTIDKNLHKEAEDINSSHTISVDSEKWPSYSHGNSKETSGSLTQISSESDLLNKLLNSSLSNDGQVSQKGSMNNEGDVCIPSATDMSISTYYHFILLNSINMASLFSNDHLSTNLSLQLQLPDHLSLVEQSQMGQGSKQTVLDNGNHGRRVRKQRQRQNWVKPESDHTYCLSDKPKLSKTSNSQKENPSSVHSDKVCNNQEKITQGSRKRTIAKPKISGLSTDSHTPEHHKDKPGGTRCKKCNNRGKISPPGEDKLKCRRWRYVDGVHQCRWCKEIFKTHKKLKKHAKQNHPERRWTCGKCSKVFYLWPDKRKHEAKHRKEEANIAKDLENREISKTVAEEINVARSGVVTCMFCEAVFASHQHLERHYAEAHPFVCCYCDNRFSTKLSLEIHLDAHSSMYKRTREGKLKKKQDRNRANIKQPQGKHSSGQGAKKWHHEQNCITPELDHNYHLFDKPDHQTPTSAELYDLQKHQQDEHAITEMSVEESDLNPTQIKRTASTIILGNSKKITKSPAVQKIQTVSPTAPNEQQAGKSMNQKTLLKHKTAVGKGITYSSKFTFADLQTRRDLSCDKCILGHEEIDDLYFHLVIFHYPQTWAKQILADLGKEILRVHPTMFAKYISRTHGEIFNTRDKANVVEDYEKLNRVSSGAGVVTCMFCKGIFASIQNLEEHYAKAHPFMCCFCDDRFSTKLSLQIHLQAHLSLLEQSQTKKGKKERVLDNYNLGKSVEKHQQMKYQIKSEPDHTYSLSDNPDKSTPKCPVCKKQVIGENINTHPRHTDDIYVLLERHMKREHNQVEFHINRKTGAIKVKPDQTMPDEILCVFCSQNFSSWLSLDVHLSESRRGFLELGHSNSCLSEKYGSAENYMALHKKGKVKDTFYVCCNICTKMFPELYDLQRHQQQKHFATETREEISDLNRRKINRTSDVKLQNFECDLCGKEFLSCCGFISHSKGHVVDVPYVCICKNVVQIEDVYCTSLRTLVPVECPRCNKKITLEVILSKFRKDRRGTPTIQTKQIDKRFTEQDEVYFMCEVCRKLFNQRSALYEHRLTHADVGQLNKYKQDDGLQEKQTRIVKHMEQNTEVQIKSWKQEKQYVCKVCREKFKEWDKFNEHKNVHQVCHICNEHFPFHSKMSYHVMMAHYPGEPRNACHTCKKGFRFNYEYKRHMALHSAERNFICEVCGKGFKKEHLLKEHKVVHSEDRPFKCQLCDRTFKRKAELKLHMDQKKGHGGAQKPYKCRMCEKTFHTSLPLIIHKRNIHWSDRERKYKCNICSKTFLIKADLNCHMDKHTGKKYPCPICKREYSMKNYIQKHIKMVHKRPGRKARGKVPA